jgi:murein DD-endopeptidase MepM/ murein hydrolase activator NlpD
MRRLAASLLVLACGACAAEGPVQVLSPYRDLVKPGRALRDGPHPAVDFAGQIGDPVLAAADGTVWSVGQDGPGRPCGNGLWLQHAPFRYTLYCHMHEVHVQRGQRVKRGEAIGTLGVSGEPSWTRPIPQLHFGLADRPRSRPDGDLDGTSDPMTLIVGCFDPGAAYPTDRLVLTYPVRCRK